MSYISSENFKQEIKFLAKQANQQTSFIRVNYMQILIEIQKDNGSTF